MKKLITMALTLTMAIGTYTFAPISTSAFAQANGTVRLEAENAQLAGSAQIDSDAESASKGKFISYIDEVGNSVTFKNVPAAKSISIGFARGNDGPGKMSLYLNDVHSKDITFPNTGGWSAIKTCALNINIPAGTNIKFQFDDGDEPINIDYINMNANVLAPAPKPAPITAAKKSIAKNLAIQVKKIATQRGQGLAGIISKNGVTLGLGCFGGEIGLDYYELKIKANAIPKDVKGLSSLKVEDADINLSQNLDILKGINTTKVSERILNSNITEDTFAKGAGEGTANFKGILYQPNGDIVIAGWENKGYHGMWMFFKLEGSQYKLYKMVLMQV